MLVILILVAIITGVIIDSFSAKYAHAASDTPLRVSKCKDWSITLILVKRP